MESQEQKTKDEPRVAIQLPGHVVEVSINQSNVKDMSDDETRRAVYREVLLFSSDLLNVIQNDAVKSSINVESVAIQDEYHNSEDQDGKDAAFAGMVKIVSLQKRAIDKIAISREAYFPKKESKIVPLKKVKAPAKKVPAKKKPVSAVKKEKITSGKK